MRYLSTRTIFSGMLAPVLGFAAFASAQSTTQGTQAPAATPAAAQQGTTAKPGVDPLKRDISPEQRKKNEKAFKKEVDSAYKHWLDEDVKWIITGEELTAFKQLSNDEERDAFIEQFWLRRDPTPDTEENEFKEEHYRRIAYANEHFPAGIPGWRTDRGRIYIVWGKPDEIESHPSGGQYQREINEGGGSTSTFPFERWRYRYLEGVGQEVIIEFVDTCMCSDYHISIDPNEKDALLHVPGAGLTQYEEMGMASKSDRLLGINSSNTGPMSQGMGQRPFDRLEQLAKLNSPPPIKFKDLEEVVNHKISYNLMPFDVRTDFVRVTSDTVLVPVTIQMKNKDMSFLNKDGVQRAAVNIFGRVTTMTGKVVTTFEDTVARDIPQDTFAKEVEHASIYWKSLPLRPGRYRMDVVLKDVNGDKKGTWTHALMVPAYSEDKLASSSLILADMMEKVDSKSVGAGSFVIGNTKVRPRVESAAGGAATFKQGQSLNIWMQVYNLSMDEKTNKPNATIEYNVVNAQTNKEVLTTQETTEAMGNVGEQLTLEKSMALAKLEPGLYRVTVKVNDNISKQTNSNSARFQVE
jgi:GWxTD domain-containing protein